METARPERYPWRRTLVLHSLLTVAIFAAIFAGGVRDANAWPAGGSGSNTMVGLNWNDWQFASFQYGVHSNIGYTKVWQGYGYTRIDSLVHDTKTNSNWWSWASYLDGSISTTFYSDSYYLATFTTNLNGWCAGPTWTFWVCDSGTLNITVLGYGTGSFQGSMGIGGDGWGTYSGAYANGSYNWSY